MADFRFSVSLHDIKSARNVLSHNNNYKRKKPSVRFWLLQRAKEVTMPNNKFVGIVVFALVFMFGYTAIARAEEDEGDHKKKAEVLFEVFADGKEPGGTLFVGGEVFQSSIVELQVGLKTRSRRPSSSPTADRAATCPASARGSSGPSGSSSTSRAGCPSAWTSESDWSMFGRRSSSGTRTPPTSTSR